MSGFVREIYSEDNRRDEHYNIGESWTGCKCYCAYAYVLHERRELVSYLAYTCYLVYISPFYQGFFFLQFHVHQRKEAILKTSLRDLSILSAGQFICGSFYLWAVTQLNNALMRIEYIHSWD